MDEQKASNDRELWREVPGDYYSPRIHVTEGGGIGINVGGWVIVAPIREWHRIGAEAFSVNPDHILAPTDIAACVFCGSTKTREAKAPKARDGWIKCEKCGKFFHRTEILR